MVVSLGLVFWLAWLFANEIYFPKPNKLMIFFYRWNHAMKKWFGFRRQWIISALDSIWELKTRNAILISATMILF